MSNLKRVSVYLDGFPFYIRPRRLDWLLVQKNVPRIAEWAPELRFVLQDSLAVSLRENYRVVRASVRRRIGMPPSNRWAGLADRLDARQLAKSGCDLVFSHRGFPVNSGDVPVVWMNAVLDPEMILSHFRVGQAALDEEIAVKGEMFHKAAAVQVCTEAEAARHARTYPDIGNRFVAVPLFDPNLRSMPESVLEKHHQAAPVKLLFVGNEPWRKGLPETLEAYMSLPETVRRSTTLTVVSHFEGNRSNIAIPDDRGITVLRGIPRSEVLALMRASHILVNVAHFESFGMVFLEAMSQGMLCLGPDWEVQRELFDYGRAGMNLHCDSASLRTAFLRAIEDEEHRIALASAGLRRFNQRYAPGVVAGRYAELFRTVGAGTYMAGARP